MSKMQPPVSSFDHQKGNINAQIVLVEYGDYQCPHCRRAYPLVKRLLEEIGSDLHFVFRNFPLRNIHPMAYSAAVSAEAAGRQDKFWEMHDLIFENQHHLSAHFIFKLGEKIGLDIEQMEEDMKSDEIRNKIEMDFESGVRSGVNSTPSFFLNGILIHDYDETYDSLYNKIKLIAPA